MKVSAVFLAVLVTVATVTFVYSSEDVATATESSSGDLDISEEEPIAAVDADDGAASDTAAQEKSDSAEQSSEEATEKKEAGAEAPVQTGPFIDLFGETLLSLQMIDETHAQMVGHYTNEALTGKKVIGLYFSADWCGPCRQFTPELVSFYNKMNSRRGKKDQFEIVWISRCRDVNSFGQYFTQMNWLAIPPEEAMGQRGQMLGEKYKVKSIPTLVLLDEVGNVITTDARNKIPQDKAGIGFPWRNPLATLYMTVFPKSLRLMVKSQLGSVKRSFINKLKGVIGMKPVSSSA